MNEQVITYSITTCYRAIIKGRSEEEIKDQAGKLISIHEKSSSKHKHFKIGQKSVRVENVLSIVDDVIHEDAI